MLLKEFIIDPELFAEPELIKGFIRDLGVDKGRILSVAPKSWNRMVLEALNKIDDGVKKKHAEILISAIRSWQVQKISVRSPSRRNSPYQEPWLTFVESFEQNPFDAILTTSNTNLLSLNPSDIWQDPESWKVDATLTTQIYAKDYFQNLERLFSLSNKVFVIDPYFNLEDSNYWPFWDELSGLVQRNPHIEALTVISSDHKAPTQILGRDQGRLEQIHNLDILIVRAGQIEGGMHDRFILTDFAGFNFTNSFQDKPDQVMDISRLSKTSYEFHFNRIINNISSFQKLN